jgi:hypothetical protein
MKCGRSRAPACRRRELRGQDGFPLALAERLRDFEWIVGPVAVVEKRARRAAGVGIHLPEPRFHRDPIRHRLPCATTEGCQLVGNDALVDAGGVGVDELDGEHRT